VDASLSRVSTALTLSHAVEKGDLNQGDHIYVYRWGLVYSHHAIVVSCGDCESAQCKHLGACCEVVHLKRTGEIALDSLGEFSQGSQVRRFRYGASTAEAMVKRAGSCSTLEPDPWFATTLRALALVTPEGTEPSVKYNLLWRNCELFTLWCKTGHRSGIKHFTRDSAVSLQSGSVGILKSATTVAAAVTVAAAAGPELVFAGVMVANGMGAAANSKAKAMEQRGSMASTGGATSSSSTTSFSATASGVETSTLQDDSQIVEVSSEKDELEMTEVPNANVDAGCLVNEQRCRVHSILCDTLRILGLALPSPLEEQCLFGSQNQYTSECKTKQCQAVAMVCDLLAVAMEDPDAARDLQGSCAPEMLSETTAFMRLQECLFEFAEY